MSQRIPCTLCLFPLPAAANAQPRNVLLLVADDVRQDLGCYGSKAARTPRLDRLAAEGTRFTDAFSTTASCSSSRAARRLDDGVGAVLDALDQAGKRDSTLV